MTGSADQAEDLVQGTYLRAWRSYSRFEGRWSLRTWLYAIATSVCLTAVARSGRRPLPAWFAGVGAVSRFLGAHVFTGPRLFAVGSVVASGQPAFASYRRQDDGTYQAHAIQVLSTAGGEVSRIVIFLDPGLFATFGLPPTHGAAPAASPPSRH